MLDPLQASLSIAGSGLRAQGARIKAPEQLLNGRTARAITPGKGIGILGVGEIQAALASQQKLAANGRHCVKQMHGHAGIHQHLCGHQASGTATDDGYGKG